MLTRKGVLVPLALALTACADAPSGPSDTALPPTAPSFDVISNRWSVLSGPNFVTFNSCGPTPEVVSIQGKLHILAKVMGDKLDVRVNAGGLVAVGLTTGNTYVMQENEHSFIVPFPFSSLPATGTLDYRSRMISKGSADNFFIVLHYSYTDPPFVFTEYTYSIDCKG